MCRSNETSDSPLLSRSLWKSLMLREKKTYRYKISIFIMLKGNNATAIII